MKNETIQVEENPSLVQKLIKEVEIGKYTSVKNLINSNNFSKKAIDIATRAYLRRGNKKKNADILHLLLEKADLNLKNEEEDDRTLLMVLTEVGELSILECFMAYNFNPNIQDKHGNTILHLVIKSELKENTVIAFIQKLTNVVKCDFNMFNANHEVPLSLALQYGMSKLTEELISLGASTKIVNPKTKDSMLHLAVQGKNPLCVKLLSNVDPSLCNSDGQTALDLAKSMNLEQIVKILDTLSRNEKPKDVRNSLLLFCADRNYQRAIKQLENEDEYLSYTNDNKWNILLCNLKRTSQPIDEKIKSLSDFFLNRENIPKNNMIYTYNKAMYYLIKDQTYPSLRESFKAFSKILNISSSGMSEINWIIKINTCVLLFDYFFNIKMIDMCGVLFKEIESMLKNYNFIYNSDDDHIKYLSYIGYVNSNFEESSLLLNLLHSSLLVMQKKCEEARKSLSEYKRHILNNKVKENSIIISISYIYFCLKIKTEYLSNSVTKFYKNVNKLWENFASQPVYDFESKIFFLNSTGVMNLKQKKYQLAEFFFKSCLSLIDILSKNSNPSSSNEKFNSKNYSIINERDFVKYNMGLSLFYQKQYKSAYPIFNELKKTMFNHKFFHYRYGLTCMEMFFLKEDFQLEMTECNLGFDEQDTSAICKRIVLKNYSSEKKEKNFLNNVFLVEAINSFRQLILISRGVSFINLSSFNISSSITNATAHIDPSVVVHSYVNIIFCLNLMENWLESLNVIQELEEYEFLDKESTILLENYKIESLVRLNIIPQAMEILKKSLSNSANRMFFNLDNTSITYYSKINEKSYSDIPYKVALYYNIIKINIFIGKVSEIEKGILTILNILNVGNNTQNEPLEVPPFLLNLIVYHLLIKKNIPTAISLLKTKRISSNFFNPTVKK